VLDLMPQNYLELLAMETGDYGASTGHSISKDPSNPGMVVISSMEQVSVLEQMDWQGFSSEDLGRIE
jgi:hypothetical protein